jgi:L,D-transpeptidase YcbB
MTSVGREGRRSRAGILLLVTALAPLWAVRSPAAAGENARTAIESALERSDSAPAALEERGLQTALRAVYARRNDAALWSKDGRPTPQATGLRDELGAADARGLDPSDYPSEASPVGGGDLDAWARRDVRLSAAVLRFLVDVHYGRVDPAKAGFRLYSPQPPLDLVATLEKLSVAGDVGTAIDGVEPQFYHYRLLERSLRQYRRLALLQADLPPLPRAPDHPVRSGESFAGVPGVRELLRLLGDLPAGEAPADGSATLDPAVVGALKRFQSRHGLPVDGVIGGATYAALATPLTRRVQQIELTLERWRWLPAFETPPIIVNIPQFRLFAFRSTADLKADILQMDVIVGRTYPGMQTPVFAADLRHVIFRPYWDVPYSIARRELVPAIRHDPRYLSSQHLEIVAGGDGSGAPLPATAENLAAVAAGRLRLRQQPGPDNALGAIKFVLPNAYDVYLHATPAHRLFSESRRAFSHGCIRVSDPVALAVHVLRDTPGDWTPERVRTAMEATDTRRVDLARPIRVMILYGTALALESGETLFFEDIYGHDRRLEALLRAAAGHAGGAPAPR